MTNSILIYTKQLTPRIQYIFRFLFEDFSGLKVEFTTEENYFLGSHSPKASYSSHRIGDELHFPADDLLTENNIRTTINFDSLTPLGQCFFALTRYEEYNSGFRDEHNRFTTENVYQIPWIDHYVLNVRKQLKEKYPDMVFKERKFRHQVTFDVDLAWQYKNKGFKRTAGALLKELITFKWKALSKRIKVLTGKIPDPFFNFDYLKASTSNLELKPIFFWLLGDYAKYDKNNPHKNKNVQKLIRDTESWAETGIHPSYRSNDDQLIVKEEINRLKEITGKDIRYSRQHFIKLEFPETYRRLINLGIGVDFTLGYAHQTGFRAGTCTPFYWFDLEKNEITHLKLIPFQVMDVTLKRYMSLNPVQAKEEIQRIKSEVQAVDGLMVSLFHNSNLTDSDDWKGWRQVFLSALSD